MEMGIECFRVQFPKGMDANEYALEGAARGEEPGRAAERRRLAGQRRAAHMTLIEPAEPQDRAGENRADANRASATERSADSPTTNAERPPHQSPKKNQKKKPNPQLKKKMQSRCQCLSLLRRPSRNQRNFFL